MAVRCNIHEAMRAHEAIMAEMPPYLSHRIVFVPLLVFDVFNERAQLGQDLTSLWVIEKNPGG
jgi:hypothetical protein